MDRCIGCPHFVVIGHSWDCDAPYNLCHREELEYDEPIDIDYSPDAEEIDFDLLEDEEEV
jgi:hypothetical protein